MSDQTNQSVVPIDEIESAVEGTAPPSVVAAVDAAPAAAPAKKAVPVDLTLSNFMKPESRAQLITEAMAALTVSLAMVPEAVAFSLTANVSPMVGMQAAWIICLVTALLGGRPGTVCGATGAVAVLLPPVVEKYGAEGLFLCVMLAGAFQAVLGVLGFGHFLIKMMPHPVMVGFCNGLAILIGFAQFNLMKTPVPYGRRLGGDTFGAFTKHTELTPWINGNEALCFAVHILIVMGVCLSFPQFKRTKNLPAALSGIIICTLLEHFVIRQADYSASTKLVRDHAGGSLAGDFPVPVWSDSKYNMPCTVPGTKPTGEAGALDQSCGKDTGAILGDVAIVSMQMALVGLIESLLTDNLIADFLDAPMDARRTCFAQGAANMICGAFGGMGGCATMGQSILNVKRIGSRSRFATTIMGIILLLIILLLSKAVEEIPVASLVGVMFMIVYDTFSWKSPALMIGSFLPRSWREWAASAGDDAPWHQRFVKNHFGTKVPHSDAWTILIVSIISILPESNLAYAVTAGILFKSITHAWGSAGFLVGDSTLVQDATGKVVKRVVVLHGDVFFASMEQLEKLFTNKQIAADPPLVEVHCEHSHLTDFSAMHVIDTIGAKYKEQGKELVITRLIPVCSRVVRDATAGNQPKLTKVTVKNIVGESSSARAAVAAEDLAIVQQAVLDAEAEDREL